MNRTQAILTCLLATCMSVGYSNAQSPDRDDYLDIGMVRIWLGMEKNEAIAKLRRLYPLRGASDSQFEELRKKHVLGEFIQDVWTVSTKDGQHLGGVTFRNGRVHSACRVVESNTDDAYTFVYRLKEILSKVMQDREDTELLRKRRGTAIIEVTETRLPKLETWRISFDFGKREVVIRNFQEKGEPLKPPRIVECISNK